MGFIKGTPRHQTTLFPDSLEDYVGPEDSVRVIDAFVERLDVNALGFSGSIDEATGRPRYHPRDLLKLYIYGYLNQVRSSRRLERECQRNIEVMWLLGRLSPDFKTIADFRKDNGSAIKRSCRAFVMFCNEMGLIGHEVAIDGSKFKAAASSQQAITRKQLQRRKQQIRERIEYYLSALDQADQGQEMNLNRQQVQKALDHLTRAEAQFQEDEEAMECEGKPQHCRTEPDARIMLSGREGFILGYNVQTSVDTQHKFIVRHRLTQAGGDLAQLYPMARLSQKLLQRSRLNVLADAGYSTGRHLQRCDDRNISTTLPARRAMNTKNNSQHHQLSDFHYVELEDVYVCPSGQQLSRKTKATKDRLYLYTSEACKSCQQRKGCTNGAQRWVSRHFEESAYERAAKRLFNDPWAMQRRRASVEAPFATLKRAMQGRFLSKGKRSVNAELSLSVLAYNFRRFLNLMPAAELIPRMETV